MIMKLKDLVPIQNEAQNKIADIRKILRTKKGKRIDSIFMDVETAKKVIKHYKSLKGSAKEKFVKQKIQNIVKSVKESVNEGDIESRELKLYIDNDGQLYNSRFMPIIKNLSKKMKKGNYDKKLAIKGFMYLVDAGAKKYVKEFGGNARDMFSKKDRIAVASDLADEFEDAYKNKEYSFMEGKEKMFPSAKVDAAVKLAKRMGGNMTNAVKKIEKMAKGLSKNGRVQYALRQANESINEEKYFDPNGELKKYMDKVLKKAGIRVIKYDPMKQSFYNGTWGGFYTVASSNMTDMPGQGKVKRSSAVLPVYIDKKDVVELGVSGDGFKLGKVGSSQVLKNLKDFKKSDLEEGLGDMVGKSIGKYNKKRKKNMDALKKLKKKESVEEAYDIWMEDGSFGYTFTGLVEAEYQGRKVKLGKPMQGDVKKFKVYVKNPKGNVVKVNFGQGGGAKGGTMKIRKSNPKARANFRARHNCDNPGPRHKARYWSCRKW